MHHFTILSSSITSLIDGSTNVTAICSWATVYNMIAR